jgi:hypothetical protein
MSSIRARTRRDEASLGAASMALQNESADVGSGPRPGVAVQEGRHLWCLGEK